MKRHFEHPHFSDFLKNNTGKYSGTALIGVFSGLACIVLLLSGGVMAYLKLPDALAIMDKALMGLTISAALMGIRKVSKTDNEFMQGDKTTPETKAAEVPTKKEPEVIG